MITRLSEVSARMHTAGRVGLIYIVLVARPAGGTWMADHEEYDGLEDQAIQVPMPEGGVMLFNGLVFHGVGHNSSGDTRMSMTLGFRSVDELDRRDADPNTILVAGENIYRGNDR